jgi:FkbM family methyltransferase
MEYEREESQPRRAVPMNEFRFSELTWRGKCTYVAHAFKAVAKQHHTDLLPILRRFVTADSVVFDVGSHSGQFAKLFAKAAPRGSVYCFEPGGYALSILRLNLSVNRHDNVTVVPSGLGDASGTCTLSVPLKPGGVHRFGLSHMGERADGAGVVREEVAMTTIDRFARRKELTRLDFLKADIEGWELRMLLGGAETIKRFRPAMMIELDEARLARAGDSLATIWNTLHEWGYRPSTWDGGDGLRPLDTPQDGNVFWVTANAASADA